MQEYNLITDPTEKQKKLRSLPDFETALNGLRNRIRMVRVGAGHS